MNAQVLLLTNVNHVDTFKDGTKKMKATYLKTPLPSKPD